MSQQNDRLCVLASIRAWPSEVVDHQSCAGQEGQGEAACVPTSQLRPVKPWLQVHMYSQFSSGLPAEGRARQSPPLRQGRPSQGSGRGVARVGVGSAGAGVSGASWKYEGTAWLKLPRSRKQQRSSEDARLLWYILIGFFRDFLLFRQSCCWCWKDSEATERCKWEGGGDEEEEEAAVWMLSFSCAQENNWLMERELRERR